MRQLRIQVENIFLFVAGLAASWLCLTWLPPLVSTASFPDWLVAIAFVTLLLGVGGRLVFEATFQAFGFGVLIAGVSFAILLLNEIVR
ncbi:MAG: hypothetical protein CBD32_06315 [Actinobacteria bacterium TMED172]|nr:MAG: hypothetical protein CBD32_06315 [Actinobacteria bacterium TMED172]